MTTENYTAINNGSSVGAYDKGHSGESYDYKVFTPWRFGLSLGHTVGNYLALGATYEYADYSTTKSRINTDAVSYTHLRASEIYTVHIVVSVRCV